MARAGILYSQVAQAASRLAAEGKNPTIDTVREALGATGSKSTIGPMLKRWKTEHQDTAIGAEIGLPIELVEAVKSLYERLHGAAVAQIDAANEAHAKELTAMQGALDAATAECERLRTTQDDLTKRLQATENESARRLRDLQDGALALTAAQTENAGLQQRLADRAAEVDNLTHQLAQARVQFEHYQEAMARQRAEERQAYEQRIGRLEQDLADGRRRQEAQQAILAQQEADLVRQAADQDGLQQALSIAETEFRATRAERDQQTEQIRAAVEARAEVNQRLAAALEALTEAKAGMAAAAKQSEMLADQLITAEKKIEQIEREKATWVERILSQQVQVKEGTRPKK